MKQPPKTNGPDLSAWIKYIPSKGIHCSKCGKLKVMVSNMGLAYVRIKDKNNKFTTIEDYYLDPLCLDCYVKGEKKGE